MIQSLAITSDLSHAQKHVILTAASSMSLRREKPAWQSQPQPEQRQRRIRMARRLSRKLVSLVCLLFLLTMTHSFVNAQPLEKLRVAYTVIAPTQATIWTAKEMGFYAKHGLDVDLVLLVGAPLAVTALVSGETPIVHAGASAVVTSNLQGSGAVLVAGGANRFPYVLFVTDEIKRVEDLRGKKFGVSRIGSADNAAAITVLSRFGIKETDVTYVQAGSIPARLAGCRPTRCRPRSCKRRKL